MWNDLFRMSRRRRRHRCRSSASKMLFVFDFIFFQHHKVRNENGVTIDDIKHSYNILAPAHICNSILYIYFIFKKHICTGVHSALCSHSKWLDERWSKIDHFWSVNWIVECTDSFIVSNDPKCTGAIHILIYVYLQHQSINQSINQ